MPPQDFLIRVIVDDRRATRRVRGFRDELGRTEGSADRLRLSLGRAFAGVSAALLIRETGRAADAFTNLQNRVRVLTDDQGELVATTQELFDISNDTRSAFDATAEVYSRTALAAQQLGVETEEVLQFTRSLNQAVVISGAAANEARAGLIQLSQGLASGALRGDELRSVLEQLPVVADVIATRLGVTRGELRRLGQDGAITADVILAAFRDAREELEERFGRTVPTLGQSFTVLRNNLVEFVGGIDQALGATAGLSQLILAAANNLDVAAAGAFVLGTVLATRYVGGALAAAGANRVLIASVAGLGPASLAATAGLAAIGTAAVVAANRWAEAFEEAQRRTNEAVEAGRDFALSDFGRVGADLLEARQDLARIEEQIARNETTGGQSSVAETRAQRLREEITRLEDAQRRLADGTARSVGQAEEQATAFEQTTMAVEGAIAAIEEENRLLQQSTREREVQVEVNRRVAALERERGTGAVTDMLREQIEEAVRLNQAYEEQAAVLERIRGPQEQLQADLAALDGLLGQNRITQQEFNAEVARLLSDVDEVDLSSLNLDALAMSARGIDVAGIRQLLTEFRDFRAPEATPVLPGQIVQGESPASVLQAQLRLLDQIRGPQQDYATTQATLNQLFDAGAVNATEYAVALNSAAISANTLGSSLQTGVMAGLAGISNMLLETSGLVESAFTNGFRNAEDAVVDFVQTGTFSLERFFDQLIADLTRLAFRQGILALLGGPAGGGFGALFGGARQFGGSVDPSRFFLVNEQEQETFVGRSGRRATIPGGPSLFSPPEAGRVVPGGGQAAPVVNVSPPQVNLRVVNVPMSDEDIAAAMASPAGEQVIVNTNRRRRKTLGRIS